MALLLGVAFLAGAVTALSPCVLPVLPVVLAGSAGEGRGRAAALVAGLVAGFTAFTLTAAALLSALGLPADLLRNVAVAVVIVVGLSLLLPPLARLVERPFLPLGRRGPRRAGGFLLGVSLGLLFTPCAGPVIAAVAAVAATERVSLDAVLVTLAYALGAGIILLGLALAAGRGLRLGQLARSAHRVRQALGAVAVAAGIVFAFGLDARLAAHVPGYTRALQGVEASAAATRELDRLVGREPGAAGAEPGRLRDFGPAPDFRGIELWLNSEPLGLADLRGRVVVLDFWTYSCVNCLRTLPFLRRWDEAYRDRGLTIVGVHTPEFAFEREPSNVRRAVRELGIRYPVALDNGYGTWTAWGNRYWPAKYFVDRGGRLRYAHFGEGDYEESEEVIRTLLAEEGLPAPVSASLPDRTPTAPQTPETYLGYERLAGFFGSRLVPDREATYRIPPAVPTNGVAYGGRWTVEGERIVAGARARLRLGFRARAVHLVLGGEGDEEVVTVRLDGRRVGRIRVEADRLYTLARVPGPPGKHLLDLGFTPGTEAYAFTFG